MCAEKNKKLYGTHHDNHGISPTTKLLFYREKLQYNSLTKPSAATTLIEWSCGLFHLVIYITISP